MSLVYLIRKFGNDYVFLSVIGLFDVYLRPQNNLAFTRLVSRSEFAARNYVTARREIGSFYYLHHLVERYFRIVDIRDYSVDDFREIMRRNIRRQTYRYARRAVYEKIRKSSRKSIGFL